MTWLVAPRRAELTAPPRLRLVCLPHAGGGAGAYRAWSTLVPPDVEVLTARLPGRESSFSQTACVRMEQVVDGLAPGVSALSDTPYVIFGHSMGAVVGLALCLRLQALAVPPPVLLVVSGHEAPHADWDRSLHTLPDRELARVVGSLSGTPADVLTDPDLINFFLPTIRADLTVLETYVTPSGERISSSISAYVGDTDNVDPEGVRRWSELTAGGFGYRAFPGGHFYLADQPGAVVAALLEDARPAAQSGAALTGADQDLKDAHD